MTLSQINAQECSTARTYDPDVCKYPDGTNFVGSPASQDADRCESVNADPFSINSITAVNGVNKDQCSEAVRVDGNDCIELYARWQCSSRCRTCNLFPCASLCSGLVTTCPTALNIGCFGTNPTSFCDTDNNNCVNWQVKTGNLPPPIDSSTTTKPTSSSTTTTDDGDDDSSSSSSSSASSIYDHDRVTMIFFSLAGLILSGFI